VYLKLANIRRLNFLKEVFSSLRSRNYKLYFIGQGVSLIGTWMQHIAMSWLVYRITGSVLLLGVVGFTSQIPMFVLSPLTGVITDRFNRRKLMLFAQLMFLLQAIIFAILVLSNLIQVWHIITLSLFFGFISALDAPARQSLVVDLIDKPENLGNAIALNSALFNGARLIGPGIAGVTIALVGEGVCFLINAISYFAVIYALIKINVQPKIHENAGNWKESFIEGYKYTFGCVPIRMLILLLATISLMGLSFVVIMPAYVKEILNGNSQTLGFLMSSVGAGALAGALFLAWRKSGLGMERLIFYNTLFLGICVIVISFSKWYLLSSLFLAFTGCTMIVSIASINTLIQIISEEDKRGRVMSFYAMALMGTTPIGNLIAGAIANQIGIPYTLLIAGLTTTVAGILFKSKQRVLKKYLAPIFEKKIV
jgi:MFS family permease